MGKHLRNQQAVVFAAESMGQRLAQRRDLGRNRPLASSANTAGSSCLPSSASRIARPVLPGIVDVTEVDLIPAS
jgi:hypothetical protein